MYWAVNNTPYYPGYQSDDLYVYQTTLTNGSIRSDLVITSLPKYNNAKIKATVYTQHQINSSKDIFLKIQGMNYNVTSKTLL